MLIVLGLYRPDLELLDRQLRSIAAQTHRNIEIFVSADGPQDAAARRAIESFTEVPIRYVESEARAGVHGNFAHGLRHALAASTSADDLFAFCDQDDVWRPDKLARQVAAFADPQTSLCHSDARIVSRDGTPQASSLFQREARSRSAGFADLLVMNSVTGMTAMFRRDVALAAAASPLSRCRYLLHDHWTALVASLLGEVRFIDEPLVDYTQHAANVMGAREWRGRLPRTRRSDRRRYLLRCYRQFIWRRRALLELRRNFASDPAAQARLFAKPVRALFDCNSAWGAGLGVSLRERLGGNVRQADQIWRIWRGKSLFCARAGR